MKFICDVNVDKRISRKLLVLGNEAIHASDLFQDGTSDPEISQWADDHDFIVITRDKDFETSWKHNYRPKRVILLRSYESKQKSLLEALVEFLPALEIYAAQLGNCYLFEYTLNNEWLFRKPSKI